MNAPRYATHEVTLPEGRLAVGEWSGGERPVLAIHGVSSTHKLWLWMAQHLAGCRLVAPDLRGRGASQGSWKSYGLKIHRDDMVAVLDQLGIEKATVVGMSLGGFIAAQLAASNPERVERLLLVDGGLPFMNATTFKSLPREKIVGSLRDRFQRLEHPWPSVAAYRDLFVSATGPLLDPDDPLLEEYLRYDLVGAAPHLTVRLDAAAVADDAADLYLGGDAERAAGEIRVPARLLYAQWSIGKDSAPAYTAEYLQPWTGKIPGFTATLMPGTDHAATVMTEASGRAIAGEINVGAATGRAG